MKNFSNKERELLSQAKECPIARYWLSQKLIIKELSVNIERRFTYLLLVENNIYCQWRQNCLEDMERIKLHDSLSELFSYISQPNVPLVKALATLQRRYAKETSKTRQKQIGKMISLLQRLVHSEKMLYQLSKKEFANGKIENVLENIASRIENADEIFAENRLFTSQCIKHYNRLTKLGIKPRVDELRLCLRPEFAENAEMFTKQVNIICSTYHEGQDVPIEVKDACFEFIKSSIDVVGYLHANLIDYVFKNDRISERAFQLFCDAEKYIRNNGMAVLLKDRATRLAEKKGLYGRPAADLSDSDVRVLRLAKMFS